MRRPSRPRRLPAELAIVTVGVVLLLSQAYSYAATMKNEPLLIGAGLALLQLGRGSTTKDHDDLDDVRRDRRPGEDRDSRRPGDDRDLRRTADGRDDRRFADDRDDRRGYDDDRDLRRTADGRDARRTYDTRDVRRTTDAPPVRPRPRPRVSRPTRDDNTR